MCHKIVILLSDSIPVPHQDDYKALCDKYASVREDFEKKMLSSCKHFQQAETLYLTQVLHKFYNSLSIVILSLSQMVDFIHSFHDLVDRGHQEVGKVNLELEESVVSLPVEKMLEQFVLQKYTGLVSSLRFQQSPDPIFTTSKTRIRCYPGETRTCRV